VISPATIKNIQDVMRKDVGVDGDAQRLGQLVWMIFLKVFDDREAEWELVKDNYVSPLPAALRWRNWAADDEGRTGDELLSFVNADLFPGLKDLQPQRGGDPQQLLLIRGVFEDAYNYMKSGVLLRQVLNILQRDLDYNRREDRHAFGDIYEGLLKGLQSAGDAGEYYTPRPVTEFAVEMVDPRLGEVIIDPACGTGGFLLCALNHVRQHYVRSVADDERLQQSIRGVEKKPLPHLLATTNMLLHGINVPTNIRHDNTLARPLRDYGPADRVSVVVTNPPFRGTEEDGIENNFPAAIRTRETADLFLALTMHLLEPGGRAAIVLPDSSLFGEGVKVELRRRLLRDCNLHTIVRLPYGVFSPYTDIRTNVLLFTKGEPTKRVWYYEVRPPSGDKYTKTKGIQREDFDELRAWWDRRRPTANAWQVLRSDIDSRGDNLDVKNPASLDVNAALIRARATREQTERELSQFRKALAEVLERAPYPIGQEARDTLLELGNLAGQVSMTSGVVEDCRVRLTAIAMRGLLSRPEPGDRAWTRR
jgi:type I restriction enzyme M protein